MTRRLLVTGGSGHLGSAVVRRAAAGGWSVTGTWHRTPTEAASERLDIRDLAEVRLLMGRIGPEVVIHTAAGRSDWRAIADGAAHVALAAAEQGVRLVHVSTDALFSGRDVYYDESAVPDPVYPYGAAKAAAETAVRAIAPAAVLARTSLIVGGGTGTHERLTHRLLGGAGGALFTDEIRTPVHVDDLAAALLELAGTGYAGVLNVSGADALSRYDLGVLVARRDGQDPARLPAGRLAGTGLSRPTDVRLRTDRATALLRTRLRGAYEFLAAVQ